MKKHHIQQITGWLFIAAGFLNVATSFSKKSPIFAITGMALFIAAIIFFISAKTSKNRTNDNDQA